MTQLRQVMSGDHALTDDDVADAFVEATDIYADDARTLARDLLVGFFQMLDEELQKSELGAVIHAREERREHDLTRLVVKESSDRIEAKQDELLTVVKDVAQQRSAFPRPADDIAKVPEVRELVMHTKVDHARDLINAGKTKTARVLLDRIRAESADQSPSNEILFRITSNIAACALEEGDAATAEKGFAEALELQPDSAKALANAALGASLTGTHYNAMELSRKALDAATRDAHAMSVRLLVLHRAGRSAEFESVVEENAWIRQVEGCLATLGLLRLEQGRWKEAKELLRNAVEMGSMNPHVHQGIAIAIYLHVQSALNEDPPVNGPTPQMRLELEEGEREITTAAESFAVYEDRSNYHNALASRAGLRSVLDKKDEALKDCEAVLVDDPDHSIALHNKALLLLHSETEDEAIGILSKLRGGDDDVRLAIYVAIAHFKKGDLEAAIAVLEPLWDPVNATKEQLDVADVLIRAHAAAGHDEAVEQLSARVRDLWAGDPEALWVLGRTRREQRRLDDAVDLMREGLAYAKGNIWDRIAFELAETLFTMKRYAEANELFARTVDASSNTPETRKYLMSLYNADLYNDALQIAQSIRAGGPPIPAVSEVEAAVFEYIGDLERALDIYIELGSIEPDVVWHRIRAVVACIRRGDPGRAREILREIDYEEIKNDAEALMQVARARMNLGLGDVLPLALRARGLDFRNPETHLTYLTLFLHREKRDEGLLEVDLVDVGCAVHLKHDAEVELVVIIDDELPLERNEVRPDDDRAKRLLGRRAGESITWKKGAYEELTYEITEVQSMYVHAFQETFMKFSTWFPEHDAIERVQIKQNDLAPILLAVDRRHELVVKAEQLYASESVTLGMLAEALDVSVIDVWGGLAGSHGQRIVAASGTTDDIQRRRGIAASTDEIVLNITAILTLAHLGLLEATSERYRRLSVAQETLDVINEHLATKYSGATPSTVMGKEEGRYVYEDVSDEAIVKGKTFLEGILDFLRDRCELVPATEVLTVGKGRFEELSKLTGREAVSSSLVAKGRGVPLVSDDLRLSLLAKAEWQVDGAWTQDVLWEMKDSKVISDEQYRDAVLKLVLSNFLFVSVTVEDVMQQLREDGMTPTPRLAFIIERVLGPDCSEESAVSVGSDVMRAVWLEPGLYEHKLLLLDLILNSITSGRPMMRVLARFDAAIRTRFALLQPALGTIQQNMQIWANERRLRRGLA